jgi:hypothetical protein
MEMALMRAGAPAPEAEFWVSNSQPVRLLPPMALVPLVMVVLPDQQEVKAAAHSAYP